MATFIASVLAAAFGLFVMHLPGFHMSALATSLAFSLLASALGFASARRSRSQAAGEIFPLHVVTGILAAATAVAGAFRLAVEGNAVPVSAGFDLLGWLAGAALTIGMSGAALLATNARRHGAADADHTEK